MILSILMALGGMGVFLFGMWQLTEGLKTAGGQTLKKTLEKGTSTRKSAFISGFGVTALVQSSSAVTVATIGFVNAKLMSLKQALWVIFGSNVGTTMTAWIVASMGFNFKLEALALPVVAVGAILRLSSRKVRRQSLGNALAGLGILFLGLAELKSAFLGVSSAIDVQAMAAEGWQQSVLLLLFGMVLTAVMQSSSAAMAIVITAVGSNMVSLEAGAAAVIGANIGTTSTALMSVIGATSVAKRVATAHVLFNLMTGLLAFILLSGFSGLLDAVKAINPELLSVPEMTLAAFHTFFNLFGVLLMIPIEPRMTAFLETRFKTREEDQSRLLFLDKATLSMPDMALPAVQNEITRLLTIERGYAEEVFVHRKEGQGVTVCENMSQAISSFIVQCFKQNLPQDLAEKYTMLFEACNRLELSLEALDAAQQLIHREYDEFPYPAMVTSCLREFSALRADDVDFHQRTSQLQEQLREARSEVLLMASQGKLGVQQMEFLVRFLSQLKRYLKQENLVIESVEQTKLVVQKVEEIEGSNLDVEEIKAA